MADWSLHIVSDRLLILSIERRVPPDVCEQIRQQAGKTLEETGVKLLLFWDVTVRDMRDAPPPVVEAAVLVDAWMREHTHDGSDDLSGEPARRA